MAGNSLTINYDQLRSITENKILPGLADAITKDNPVLFRLMRNSRTIDGGVNIQKVIRYAESTQGGAIALGLTELDAAEEENRTRAYWTPKKYHQPIVISNDDLARNGGQAKVLDYLTLASEDAMLALKGKFGTDLYTAQSGNKIDSLVDACDDKSNVDSYGGISRTSYSWWEGQYDGTGGSLSLSMLATQVDSQTNGNIEPDLIVTTKAVWSLYEALLQPQARYNTMSGASTIDGGFRSLEYRGIPMVRDEYCTAGYMYLLNTKFLEMVNFKHSEFKTDKNGFAVSPFRVPNRQDGQVAYIFWLGDLICWNPKYQGVIRTIS